jgi:transglutaminase-like putative cysteine protease
VGDGLFAYHPEDAPSLAQCIARRHPDAGQVGAWAARFLTPGRATVLAELLPAMTRAIRADFAYRLRLEGAPQSPAETIERRTGSCRDFAVLLIEAARSLGLAARFVSGYVYSPVGRGRRGGGHTHAWAQVYVPACGWVDLDPTNAIIGNRDLIRVACVADPVLATPLHGSWDGRRGDFLGMDVEVEVRLEAEPAAQPVSRLRVARGG